MLRQPAFLAYVGTCVVLVANLMFLWAYSGVVRARIKQTTNEEDAAAFGAALVDAEPPAVARVLRAHRNAEASIVPFLLVGLTFVLAGGGATLAIATFTVFAAARLLHSVAYLNRWQPWRTIFFVAGSVAFGVLLVATAGLAIRAF